MKNIIIIIAVVLVLIGATYYADKATRVSGRGSTHAAVTGDKTVGMAAPQVSFKELSGQDTTLNQYQGKVVLVNFWATWCDPCREEIPWLIEMQQKYGSRGFTVLGIAMDEEGKSVVEPFVSKEHFDVGGQKLTMNYPIVLGNDEIATKFGGLLGYPTSVLISRDGKVAKRITGLLNYEEISKMIEAQL